MKQSNYNPTFDGVVLDIMTSGTIGAITEIIARELGMEPVKALELFYPSRTCAQLHDRGNGLYLYSDHHIAAEFIQEYRAATL